MNLLLLDPDEVTGRGDGAMGEVRLEGRRARHLLRVLQVEPGQELRAAILGRGHQPATRCTARVLEVEAGAVLLGLEEGEGSVGAASPATLPVHLALALPRPKALRRLLRTVASLGVERLDLLNAWKVEKSYFQSPLLEPAALERELRLGAEQGAQTRLPEVALHRFYRGFVESLEGETGGDGREARAVLHPREAPPLEVVLSEAVAEDAGGEPPSRLRLAIGPEGGWIDRELEGLARAGFRVATLGPWVLTTETAVAVALGQVALWGRGWLLS